MFKKLSNSFKNFEHKSLFLLLIIPIALIILAINYYQSTKIKLATSENQISQLKILNEKTNKDFLALKNIDQVKRNDSLEKNIKEIEKTYTDSVKFYEDIVNFRDQKRNTTEYEKLLVLAMSQLSKKDYASATSTLKNLNTKIEEDNAKIAAAKAALTNVVGNTSNVAVNNNAPSSGYSRQKVKTDFGEYLVDLIAADLGSTRVVVDTASDSDCRDNCPVLSLGDYVGRNGAFAGINGSYFCPASYPSCAGKTNSFDTLLMNKNKKYFNSDNNVYSTVPAVIFQGGSIRYVSQSLQWGRDTGVDGVLANQPLLVLNGNVVFGGDDEVKRSGAGSRSFVGSTGSTVYIGVVHGVNAAQMARVLKTMGIQNALNLDSGGSTALWSGGYKVGPGRNIPNAILFLRK